MEAHESFCNLGPEGHTKTIHILLTYSWNVKKKKNRSCSVFFVLYRDTQLNYKTGTVTKGLLNKMSAKGVSWDHSPLVKGKDQEIQYPW